MTRRMIGATSLVLAAVAAVGPRLAEAGPPRAHAPTACASIDAVPRRFDIDYALDVQPIFDARCANCHVNSAGAPEAGLELDEFVSWINLVDVPSSQNPSLTRVKAYDPDHSLLFQKLNCDTPPVGQQMPFERPPIPVAEQALIHDWIELGAWETTSDTLFFNGLEDR